MTATHQACERCVERAWLLGRLAGHLELARGQIEETLALADDELIAAVAGRRREAVARDRDQLDVRRQRLACDGAGIETICRCDPLYPGRLRELTAPPAVLHVIGGVARMLEVVSEDPVAIVGSRHASEYGREIAHSLGRGVASAGVTVVSGMAAGVDAAAHRGALEAAGARTVAVLPAGLDRPYPATQGPLYRKIAARAAAVSELPPGTTVRRWMFPARNRIIAALAAMTVVVEAAHGSGALITARIGTRLGRTIGAVPGRVTSSLAAGPHGLLAAGARLVAGPRDVLDELYGADAPDVARLRPALEPRLAELLTWIGDGLHPAEALAGAGLTAGEGLAALSSLELAGYVRRAPGGRYVVVP